MTNLYGKTDISAAACQVYYNDKRLNGSKISGFDVSANLDDDDIIVSFYSKTTGCSHGWVVFQTKKGNIYRCHLVGIPGQLIIRVEDSEWKTNGFKVSSLTQELTWKIFKSHIRVVIKNWGEYNCGFHDCRHFAEDVDNYLKRHC
ncbi:unnamed protein product [Adineta ricciae]|uniref:Uncharacterized protein n=1 Tax=Adineta ricciae TaxID=249248 RepID=A0A815E056_ADIRI|nr:unnamed protein product [Adineta ricciae]CAF1303500.1 unnamed protein product [Adineta ricciae]